MSPLQILLPPSSVGCMLNAARFPNPSQNFIGSFGGSFVDSPKIFSRVSSRPTEFAAHPANRRPRVPAPAGQESMTLRNRVRSSFLWRDALRRVRKYLRQPLPRQCIALLKKLAYSTSSLLARGGLRGNSPMLHSFIKNTTKRDS